MISRKKRIGNLIFRLTIILFTIVLLFYFFWRLRKDYDIVDIKTILSNSNYLLLLVALFLMLLSLIIKSYRYYILVKHSTPTMSFLSFIPPFLIGYGFSILGPFKTGEVVSIEINKQTRSIPRTTSIAALAIFRIFDLLITIAFFAVAFLTTIPKITAARYHVVLSLTFIVSLGGALFLSIVLFFPPIGRIIIKITAKLLGIFSITAKNWAENNLSKALSKYYNSLTLIRKQKLLSVLVFILTLTRWLLEFFAFKLTLCAFKININFIDVISLSTITLFVGLLSLTPAGLGSGTLTSQALLEAMKADPLAAATAIVYQSLISQGLCISLALVSSIFIKRTKMDEKRNRNTKELSPSKESNLFPRTPNR